METILIDQKDIASLAVQKHTEPLHRLSAEWGLLESQFQNKVFLVSGYDNDSRELHEIEEVGVFMEHFNRECPFWLFFALLDDTGSNAWMVRCLCATGQPGHDEDGQVVVVLARNVFETETPLQLLPVAGKPVTLSTPQMRDSTGRPLQRATPHRLVTFPWVPGALPWTVVRMPRREPSQQQAV